MWATPTVTFLRSRRRGRRPPGFGLAMGLLPHLLLARHGLLRALAGPGVGMGALATDRQAPAMADALVGADLHLALDVLLDVPAQVALDLDVGVDPRPQPDDLLVGEVADPGAHVDARGLAHLLRGRATHTEDVGERDL